VHLSTIWHIPVLAIYWQRAFVPTLFAARGKQPIRVLSPYDAISAIEGNPVPSMLLGTALQHPYLKYAWGYSERWEQDFDYIIYLRADTPEARADLARFSNHTILRDAGFAVLIRINRPTGP
jgi:hypothetical protein